MLRVKFRTACDDFYTILGLSRNIDSRFRGNDNRTAGMIKKRNGQTQDLPPTTFNIHYRLIDIIIDINYFFMIIEA